MQSPDIRPTPKIGLNSLRGKSPKERVGSGKAKPRGEKDITLKPLKNTRIPQSTCRNGKTFQDTKDNWIAGTCKNDFNIKSKKQLPTSPGKNLIEERLARIDSVRPSQIPLRRTLICSPKSEAEHDKTPANKNVNKYEKSVPPPFPTDHDNDNADVDNVPTANNHKRTDAHYGLHNEEAFDTLHAYKRSPSMEFSLGSDDTSGKHKFSNDQITVFPRGEKVTAVYDSIVSAANKIESVNENVCKWLNNEFKLPIENDPKTSSCRYCSMTESECEIYCIQEDVAQFGRKVKANAQNVHESWKNIHMEKDSLILMREKFLPSVNTPAVTTVQYQTKNAAYVALKSQGYRGRKDSCTGINIDSQYPSHQSIHRNDAPVPSYMVCPSEVLQKTTNFDCLDSITNTNTDLEIRGNISSQFTMDHNNEYAVLDAWCPHSCHSQTFVNQADCTVCTSDKAGPWTLRDNQDCLSDGTTKDSAQSKFNTSNEDDKIISVARSIKNNTQRILASKNSVLPSRRYKTSRHMKNLTFRYLQQRRWIHVWKKKAKFQHLARSPFKFKKFRMVHNLQRAILWEDVDAQTNIVVFREVGIGMTLWQLKSACISTSANFGFLKKSCEIEKSNVQEISRSSFRYKVPFKHINVGPSRFPFEHNANSLTVSKKPTRGSIGSRKESVGVFGLEQANYKCYLHSEHKDYSINRSLSPIKFKAQVMDCGICTEIDYPNFKEKDFPASNALMQSMAKTCYHKVLQNNSTDPVDNLVENSSTQYRETMGPFFEKKCLAPTEISISSNLMSRYRKILQNNSTEPIENLVENSDTQTGYEQIKDTKSFGTQPSFDTQPSFGTQLSSGNQPNFAMRSQNIGTEGRDLVEKFSRYTIVEENLPDTEDNTNQVLFIPHPLTSECCQQASPSRSNKETIKPSISNDVNVSPKKYVDTAQSCDEISLNDSGIQPTKRSHYTIPAQPNIQQNMGCCCNHTIRYDIELCNKSVQPEEEVPYTKLLKDTSLEAHPSGDYAHHYEKDGLDNKGTNLESSAQIVELWAKTSQDNYQAGSPTNEITIDVAIKKSIQEQRPIHKILVDKSQEALPVGDSVNRFVDKAIDNKGGRKESRVHYKISPDTIESPITHRSFENKYFSDNFVHAAVDKTTSTYETEYKELHTSKSFVFENTGLVFENTDHIFENTDEYPRNSYESGTSGSHRCIYKIMDTQPYEDDMEEGRNELDYNKSILEIKSKRSWEPSQVYLKPGSQESIRSNQESRGSSIYPDSSLLSSARLGSSGTFLVDHPKRKLVDTAQSSFKPYGHDRETQVYFDPLTPGRKATELSQLVNRYRTSQSLLDSIYRPAFLSEMGTMSSIHGLQSVGTGMVTSQAQKKVKHKSVMHLSPIPDIVSESTSTGHLARTKSASGSAMELKKETQDSYVQYSCRYVELHVKTTTCKDVQTDREIKTAGVVTASIPIDKGTQPDPEYLLPTISTTQYRPQIRCSTAGVQCSHSPFIPITHAPSRTGLVIKENQLADLARLIAKTTRANPYNNVTSTPAVGWFTKESFMHNSEVPQTPDSEESKLANLISRPYRKNSKSTYYRPNMITLYHDAPRPFEELSKENLEAIPDEVLEIDKPKACKTKTCKPDTDKTKNYQQETVKIKTDKEEPDNSNNLPQKTESSNNEVAVYPTVMVDQETSDSEKRDSKENKQQTSKEYRDAETEYRICNRRSAGVLTSLSLLPSSVFCYPYPELKPMDCVLVFEPPAPNLTNMGIKSSVHTIHDKIKTYYDKNKTEKSINLMTGGATEAYGIISTATISDKENFIKPVLGSCRYYSHLLTKQLARVKENLKQLKNAEESVYQHISSIHCKADCTACTMIPSGRVELCCQTGKHEKLYTPLSRCVMTPSETNIGDGQDKKHLKSIYYMLTAIEGRLRRLKHSIPN